MGGGGADGRDLKTEVAAGVPGTEKFQGKLAGGHYKPGRKSGEPVEPGQQKEE